MPTWEHFAMEEPRPESVVFTEAERADLEVAVSEQVAMLLSMFGKVEEADLDMGASTDFVDEVVFKTIALEPYLLEDDYQLVLNQLPRCDDTWNTRPGVHHIELLDEEGEQKMTLTVHDPSHNAEPPIYHCGGQRVRQDVLQELFEVLAIQTCVSIDADAINIPPLDTTIYPQRKADPDFDNVLKAFEL